MRGWKDRPPPGGPTTLHRPQREVNPKSSVPSLKFPRNDYDFDSTLSQGVKRLRDGVRWSVPTDTVGDTGRDPGDTGTVSFRETPVPDESDTGRVGRDLSDRASGPGFGCRCLEKDVGSRDALGHRTPTRQGSSVPHHLRVRPLRPPGPGLGLRVREGRDGSDSEVPGPNLCSRTIPVRPEKD